MGKNIQWQELNSEEDIQTIERHSSNRPVLVFKHSRRCGLSHSVKKRLEEEWKASHPDIAFYHLDLLAHRSVSDCVEKRWKIPHQSPQAILMYDKNVIYHGSHQAITADRIREELSVKAKI